MITYKRYQGMRTCNKKQNHTFKTMMSDSSNSIITNKHNMINSKITVNNMINKHAPSVRVIDTE